MANIAELLCQHYQEHPNQISIYLQHAGLDDRPISYRSLIRGASAYAVALDSQNIQPGEVVVLILQHGIDLIHAFYGAILHGAIPSIMPFLTEKLLPERYRADLRSLVSITKPAAIITYSDFESEVREALKSGNSVRSVIFCETVSQEIDPDFGKLKGFGRLMDEIVLLQHSSGTTGLQKGVALTHTAVLNQLQSYSQAINLEKEDMIVSWLPLYHDMGLIAGFLQPVILGIPLVLMSPFDWVRAPQRLLQAVSKYHGTLSWLPNFAYNFCAQKIRDRHLDGINLSSWRAVINCSEPVRYESHETFLEHFQNYGLSRKSLATSYAMAENVFGVTQGGIGYPLTIDEIDRDKFQEERIATPAMDGRPTIKMVSCGKSIPGTVVKILSEIGGILPDRFVGEVAIRSDCMLSGYYNRPDETAKAMKDGWYLTGDFGYMVDGELYVSGRKKDLIIVGGKNIYPQDLENLAMNVQGVHPGRVSAFGIYNEEIGTEDVVIVAEVDEPELEIRENIAEEIRQVVTRGSAVALRNVYIVNPSWLVKTSSGKNARLANREKYIQETQL